MRRRKPNCSTNWRCNSRNSRPPRPKIKSPLTQRRIRRPCVPSRGRSRFAALYPVFFFDAESALDLLGGINSYVHEEVQKLYPDAQFPHFDVARESADRLTLVYRSARPLADLADGLIRGCVAHFGRPVTVEREDLAPDGRHTRFVLIAEARAPRG